MPDYLVITMILVLIAVGLVCGLGVISDIRTGKSRQAHEDVGAAREQLPLNYWMGVGQKLFGMLAAFGIATALVLNA